jgi:hypothetical protein
MPAYQVHPVEVHYRGPNWAGFRFGAGALLARVYSKTIQARTDYGARLTLEGYGNPSGHVIRVEFQLRADALASMNAGDGLDLRDWDTLSSRLRSVWAYLTTSWLSLRLDSDSQVVRNRLLDPVWLEVASAFDGGDTQSGAIVRSARAPLADVRALITQAVGCVVSAAASLGLHHSAPAPSVLLAWLRRVRYLVGLGPDDVPALDKGRFSDAYARAWVRYAGAAL